MAYKDVTRTLQGRCTDVAGRYRTLQDVARTLHGRYMDVTWTLHGRYKDIALVIAPKLWILGKPAFSEIGHVQQIQDRVFLRSPKRRRHAPQRVKKPDMS